MKTHTEHNSSDLEQGWNAVEEYAQHAHLAAWDTCHKIYLAMDEVEAEWFRNNYEAIKEGSPEEIVAEINEWWDASCSLRFVSAVYNNPSDPNAGFVSLIDQFAGYEDEDDDEEDEEV